MFGKHNGSGTAYWNNLRRPPVRAMGSYESALNGQHATMKSLQMTQEVYDAIRIEIGNRRPEQGGMLGGDRDEGVIRCFHFDDSARRTGGTYTPDHVFLNRLLDEDWNPKGIRLMGFVHSHPGYFRSLSSGDRDYARRILLAIKDLEELILPIVIPIPEERGFGRGEFELIPYVATLDNGILNIEQRQLEIVGATSAVFPVPASGIESDARSNGHEVVQNWAEGKDDQKVEIPTPFPVRISKRERNRLTATSFDSILDEYRSANGRDWHDTRYTFRRVSSAYDAHRLSRARLFVVGAGGAADFVEDMARTGLAEFVLIDGDVVSESNLATQQTYRKDIERPKVECLKERILDINPNATVETRCVMLDELDDEACRVLLVESLRQEVIVKGHRDGPFDLTSRPLKPKTALICGLTDSFEAQARVNRLALQFGLPSLCAQVYFEGLGGEITFTHPNVTPACHRCVLGSRYRAYREHGFQNDVTSDGTPIFSTSRLNALKGQIALALLHEGTGHERWDRMLRRIGNRNLIQIRMAPIGIGELSLPAFRRVFEGADRRRVLFDDVVWLPQQPENPSTGFDPCPDCGGTGNLRDAFETFSDTREWDN